MVVYVLIKHEFCEFKTHLYVKIWSTEMSLLRIHDVNINGNSVG